MTYVSPLPTYIDHHHGTCHCFACDDWMQREWFKDEVLDLALYAGDWLGFIRRNAI